MLTKSEAAQVARTSLGATAIPLAVFDHKAWAHTLKARHDKGEKLNPNQVRCYRNGLGLNAPQQ